MFSKYFIDDINVKDIKLSSLRQKIGVVQQDVFLFFATVRENIIYGKPDAKEDEIIQGAKDENIHEYIISLSEGYNSFISERGVKLSGGQKQRIAIARVFFKNSAILILDEAITSLDNTTELAIQTSIEKLSKDRTTVIIAHRLSTIKNADEIIVLSNKGIIERESHYELIKSKGRYSELYNAQFNGFISDEV